MLERYEQVIECSLDNTLRTVTNYCLKDAATSWEKSVAQTCYAAGRTRLGMSFVQQEDVAFVWVDRFNTQALVCTFKLSHHLIAQIGEPSLNLQRLKWQLIFPANTKDDIAGASDMYLLDTAIFRRITREFDDSVVDLMEAAIVEMSY